LTISRSPAQETRRRDAAKAFIARSLAPLLQGIVYEVTILSYSIHATSVGKLVTQNAADLGVAMIVACAKAPGGLRELLLGSTTAYLCHHAAVPVVVVR